MVVPPRQARRPGSGHTGTGPAHTYAATSPKAALAATVQDRHFRMRMDRIDTHGTASARYAGRHRHRGIGRSYKHQPVRLLTVDSDVIVVR